jgi:hypothetical protein
MADGRDEGGTPVAQEDEDHDDGQAGRPAAGPRPRRCSFPRSRSTLVVDLFDGQFVGPSIWASTPSRALATLTSDEPMRERRKLKVDGFLPL